MVTLKLEIPGSMPPLIEEMLEDLQDLEKDQREHSESTASLDQQTAFQCSHPGSSRDLHASDVVL